jgi:N-acetylglucosamine kinase-like BadF-type ATPase
MTARYLGVDGGGTKTHAVILDETGRVRGSGFGGSSNFGYVGIAQAAANIRDAVRSAAEAAGTPASGFDAAFLGLAGVVSQADRDVAAHIARTIDLAPDAAVGVDHDGRVALAGGLAGEPGIVQIIGTGTSCFGMTESGERWMAGGWGTLIADEGGGFWLGVQAMKAAAAAADTRGQPTVLLQHTLDGLGIQRMDQIMARLYTDKISVAEVAALAPRVIEAAKAGDAVAQAIIGRGVDEVARCVEAVARYLRFGSDVRVVYVGGITKAGETITTPLNEAIRRRLPQCRIQSPQFSAATGAALLAYQRHRGAIGTGFLAALTASAQDQRGYW